MAENVKTSSHKISKGNAMNQPVSTEELIHTQVLTVEALVRVLERKGVLSRDEVLAEVAVVKNELSEKRRKN
jgi:hypothetical protein